jgi:hypothetical protein
MKGTQGMTQRIRHLLTRFAIVALAATAVLGVVLAQGSATPAKAVSPRLSKPICALRASLCTETVNPWGPTGAYTGHDEPSVLYYSNGNGSGNSNLYVMRLPTDPPKQPTQSGTGGTFNFQLHPAFWFGMALCDTQSAPLTNPNCAADSDSNIYDNPNPSAPDYIGNHPGGAYMEMQFYPPSWVPWAAGDSCGAKQWCAALNIDSFSENQLTGQINNGACLNSVGIEPVNFAFITKNGVAQAPANPVDATLATYTPNTSKDLFMNSGDVVAVYMHDTAAGFQVDITDLTTHQHGSMTAGAANTFGQVKFDPNATSCTNIPYNFHPMYATSSEHTRLTWTAHAYNVSFSDEIGHFEYCNAIDGEGGSCTAAGASDPSGVDGDDSYCFDGAASSMVKVTGCYGTDDDFDGVPYQKVWPGTLKNPLQDRLLHPSSVLFTSPLYNLSHNYSRVAFETDLPRIEFGTNPACNRQTGANCVNPPVGANFYPFFTTGSAHGVCYWQLGGAYIPGTTNEFGGSSSAEFGGLLQLFYPVPGPSVVYLYNDFRQVVNHNPCAAGGGDSASFALANSR